MQNIAKSCQELDLVFFNVFKLRFHSEGTLGPVDYHCRAPFKWIHGTEIGDDARLCGATLCAMECVGKVRSQRDLIVRYLELWRRAPRSQKPFLALSSGAATTEVAAEQLTAGAGQQEGHVDTVVKSWQELEIYVF